MGGTKSTYQEVRYLTSCLPARRGDHLWADWSASHVHGWHSPPRHSKAPTFLLTEWRQSLRKPKNSGSSATCSSETSRNLCTPFSHAIVDWLDVGE